MEIKLKVIDRMRVEELPEKKCKHLKENVCELGIKTWCGNCRRQQWGFYVPVEDSGK